MAKHPAKCPRCGRRLEYDTAADERIVCPSCQAALSVPGKVKPSDKVDPLLGQALGEFEVVELLGRGGMGAVYKARQPSLGRFVALKVLRRSASRDISFVERFGREARAAAAVNHPNIIQVYAVGQDKGFQFIAMELVEGESVGHLLGREGRAAPDRALDLLKQVASALAAAHAKGIVHRDIKPANILLAPTGIAKVADFGLAKRAGVDASVTQDGQTLGTPLYLSPEAARGEGLDARSDLYSLGATFYHVLAGRPPFQAETPMAVILKHVEAEAPPLVQAAPDAPPALCRIIHRLLRKNPADRFQSAEDLLDALSRVEGVGAALRGRPPGVPEGAHAGAPLQPSVPPPAGSESRGRARRARADRQGATLPMPAAGERPIAERLEARARRRRKLLLFGGIAAALLVLVVVLVVVVSSPRPQATTPALPSGPPTPDTQHPPPSPVPPTPGKSTPSRPPPPPAAGKWKVYTEWPFDATEAKRRQEETAKALGVKVEQDIDLGNGVKMTFVLIPAGEFLMGSPPTTSPDKLAAAYGAEPRLYQDEFPQHRVRISQPFWIGKYEITQEQWMAIFPTNPSANKGKPKNPVENVRWDKAHGFANELGARLGIAARLPTEAEWEYSCRAGSATEFYFGDDSARIPDFGWAGTSSTAPVGQKKPNAWRLYDMAGNVLEWCEDLFGGYGSSAEADPKGAPVGSTHVLRGGSWYSPPFPLRSAYRDTQEKCAGDRAYHLGLRVVAGTEPGLPQVRPQPRTETQNTPITTHVKVPAEQPTPPLPAGLRVYTEWPFDAAEAKRRQEETAKALGVPVEQDTDLGKGVKMTFVLIPAGEFLMGSPPSTSPEKLAVAYGGDPKDYEGEFPQHRVTISRPFWMGKCEVTQEQWVAVLPTNPSWNKDKPKNPVEQVDWNQARGFAKVLSEKLGKTFRLPTEAEWEYACRAGTATQFYFGNDAAKLADFGWCGCGSTAPVGVKKRNAWGLLDMAGNVREWCDDWHGRYQAGAQADPEGAVAGSARVLRGGSFYPDPRYLRSACRDPHVPGVLPYIDGFRLVLAAEGVAVRPPAPAPPPPAAGPAKVYTEWPFDAAEAKRGQEETAKALGVSVEQDVDLGNGVKMTFVLIPAGEFLMGSPAAKAEVLRLAYGSNVEEYEQEFPQHQVKITRAFWIGKYEVTQEQWQALVPDNPSTFKDNSQNPVESVDWNQCHGFCKALSEKLGRTFRLPTEAEWEYACRAGTASEFYFGDSAARLPEFAGLGGSQPVGRRKPNAWGLHDMAGSVWEWCEDWYGPYGKGAQRDPQGPGAGASRVMRGGSWSRDPRNLRSAYRASHAPGTRANDIGFRVVLVAEPR